MNYAELNEPHIPQLSRRDVIYYHQHRTRQSRLEEEEEERKREDKRKKIEEAERKKREEEEKACKLLVTTEYKGDTSDWRERQNDTLDSHHHEEDEEKEDKVRKLVCRIPIPRIMKPLCQQTSMKPDLNSEGRPSLEYPAHEALLPPPLPPLSPPPSTQEDRLSMTQTTLLSTCTRISEPVSSFTSCSSGSLCRGLESSTEECNSCQTDSAQNLYQHHTMAPPEDQTGPVNNTATNNSTIF